MAYDIHIQIIPAAALESSKFYGFGSPHARGVQGLQKLINMFAKYLLTPVGSNPLDLEEGTAVPMLIGSNVDANDAKDILILAVDKTTKAIQAHQRLSSPPADEHLASASVTQYIVFSDRSGFSAQIHIQNTARQGLTFLLPALVART